MKFNRHLAAFALLLATTSALAVKTEFWAQTSADDFGKGTSGGVVVTKNGQLRLSRKIESILPNESHFDSIPAVAEAPDESIVFGAFPTGEVKRLKDGKLTTVASFTDQAITSIAFDDKGRLLVSAGGEKGRVYRIEKDGDKPKLIFENDDAKYVWAIVPDGDRLLLATGPSGGVYEIGAGGVSKKVADLDGNNVLCLVKGPDGNLYAGTDGEGLVYRIDSKTDKTFVMYDAAESEISALAFDKAGNLLAATSEVKPDQAGAGEEKLKHGKPEKPNAGESAIKGKPPAAPKQPDHEPGDAIPSGKPSPPPAPLDDAKADGKADAKADVAADAKADAAASEPAKAPAGGQPAVGGPVDGTGTGNALYRIDGRGFATELWRGDVVIYGLAVSGDSILLATGDDGQIEEIRPGDEDSGVLARTDGATVNAILTTRDGSLLVATSEAGQLLKISAGNADSGAYESDVLDAGMTSAFGKMHLVGQMPNGTSISVQTRSGNTKDPETGGWDDWTNAAPAKEFLPVTSPAAQFLQFRLTLATKDAGKSPVVDEVSEAYQKPNLAPHISAVTVTPAADAANPGAMTVAWEAADPNEDELRYSVFIKAQGQAAWIKLADDLTETSHTWATRSENGGVPDGRYDVKVVASDARANLPGEGKQASRVSDSVLIDNTPPVIGDIKTDIADGKATVHLRVVDRSGTVAGLETTLDRVDHWQKQLPDDKIADSPEETYTVSLGEPSKGLHALTVRATDDRGNAALETVTITIP